MLLILSQSVADPNVALAGASGWVGTGLLGLVLAWLMWVNIPAKDKQLKELLESKDAQADKNLAAFRDELRLDRSLHDAALIREQDIHRVGSEKLASLLMENTTETRKLAATVGNLAERIGETHRGPAAP